MMKGVVRGERKGAVVVVEEGKGSDVRKGAIVVVRERSEKREKFVMEGQLEKKTG